MFDFSDCIELTKENNTTTCQINKEKFDNLFLKWYDTGEPEHNFDECYEMLGPYLLYDYQFPIEAIIEHEPRRWYQWVEHIINVKDRYFSIGFDRGLTAQQENSDEVEIYEVTPQKKVVVTTEWITV